MPRHQLTPDERRRGGQRRAEREDWRKAQRHGGKVRAGLRVGVDGLPLELRRADFVEHQRERGRKGAQALINSGRRALLMEKIALYQQRHPSAPEAWLRTELTRAGLTYGQHWTAAHLVHLPDRWCILDSYITGPGGNIAIEPGHRLWHGRPHESIDGRDHRAADLERAAALLVSGVRVHYLDAELIDRYPDMAREHIYNWLGEIGLGPYAPPSKEIDGYIPF